MNNRQITVVIDVELLQQQIVIIEEAMEDAHHANDPEAEAALEGVWNMMCCMLDQCYADEDESE